ncbi:MAG TPA: hypothetical protein VMH83_04570 [Candidatus Acidoferrum sp.]|nr:hypothetical protein [Candidatus Acidoferrum sp.]
MSKMVSLLPGPMCDGTGRKKIEFFAVMDTGAHAVQDGEAALLE